MPLRRALLSSGSSSASLCMLELLAHGWCIHSPSCSSRGTGSGPHVMLTLAPAWPWAQADEALRASNEALAIAQAARP